MRRPRRRSFLTLALASVASVASLAVLPAAAAVAQAPPSFSLATLPIDAVELLDLEGADTDELVGQWRRAQQRRVDAGELPLKSRRIAEPLDLDVDLGSIGTRETLQGDGSILRLRIRSRGALHLSLAFEPLVLPAAARLWIYDPARTMVRGPFTAQDVSSRGRMFTPLVPGDEVVVELHLPDPAPLPSGATAPGDPASDATVWVRRAHHGFAPLVETKQAGVCNRDVVCPEGDAWGDQIRSVGLYVTGGSVTCTGQLVNNGANDRRPLFLSAYHCEVEPDEADAVVVYWNHQSPVCGQQGGGSLDQFQMGSTYLAGDFDTDFLLLELDQVPDPAFGVHYAGWDVTGLAPPGAVGIHHPQGQEKSISLNDDPLLPSDIWVPGTITHWEVDDWELGTTEVGSSGSCIFDPETGLCVGVLTGGFASCTEIEADFYGRLDVAWNGGPDPSTRLRDWLDPEDRGVVRLGGIDAGAGPPSGCTADHDTACLLGGRFQVEGVMTDFSDPPQPFANRVMTFGNGGRAATDQAVFFESFTPGNFEAGVKMVDACSLPEGNPLRAYWAFFGALTNAETELAIVDTVTLQSYQWFNPAGQFPRSVGDTMAFPCVDGPPAEPCSADDTTACLLGERFRVTGAMKNFENPPESFPTRVMNFPGIGRAESSQAVFFESFTPGNFEAGVKMVDACSFPEGNPLRAYWVFYGALTNAETAITVTQMSSGLVDQWFNPAGSFPLSEGRTNAFPCD